MNSPLSRLAALAAFACVLSAPTARAGDATVDVWSQLVPEHAPPAPLGSALVENNAHGLVLIHGAPSVPWGQSVYRFDGADWTPVSNGPPAGAPSEPPKATRFAATGDTGRGYSLLFGGVVDGEFSDVTIAYDGQTFQRRAVDQEVDPPERADAAMAYFAPNDLVVLFGGVNDTGLLGDTWFYNGELWFRYLGETQPSPRTGHSMAYDPQRNRIILYGGMTADGPSDETWMFDGKAWSLYTFAGPSPRSGHTMFFDEGRGRVVLVGGLPQENGVEVAETWEWTGTNWRMIESAGPTPRINAKAAYDPQRGVAVLFGGVSEEASLLNDTWELELESPFDVVIETPTGLRPTDVTTGFFNDDIFPEALVTDALTSGVFVFPNLGVPGLIPRGGSANDWSGFGAPDEVQTSGPPGKIEAADINGDGNQDIVVAIPGGGGGMEPGSEFFLGDGQGGFTAATTLTSDFGQDDVQPGDLDNVKDLRGGLGTDFIDLAYVSTSSQLVGVIEGNNGGFDAPLVLAAGGEPTNIAIGDVNLDDMPDLVFTDRANGTVVVVPQRNGTPRFVITDRIDFPVGLPGAMPVDLVLLDLNGNGRLDVATADSVTNTVTTLINLGPGKESWLGFFVTDITPTGANPVSIDAANFYGGPLPDLATANAAGDTVSILRNLGNGLFADPINLSVNPGPVAVATADLNFDGLDDIVVASAPPSPPGILTAFLGRGQGPCPGDVDGDRYVGFQDLSILIDVFGITGFAMPADFDADGSVTFQDLNLLLTNFGVTCP